MEISPEVISDAKKISENFKQDPLNLHKVAFRESLTFEGCDKTNEYSDERGGKYFELLRNSQPTQFFVANLLKGFVATCDVVKVKWDDGEYKYFSYVPPEEDYENIEVKTSEQQTAERLLLDLVFGDYDRTIFGDPGNNATNVNGRYVNWDFDRVKASFFSSEWMNTESRLNEILGLYRVHIEKNKINLEQILNGLSLLAKEMLNEYSGKTGYQKIVAVFEALKERGGLDSFGKLFKSDKNRNLKVKDFYEEFIKRLSFLASLK